MQTVTLPFTIELGAPTDVPSAALTSAGVTRLQSTVLDPPLPDADVEVPAPAALVVDELELELEQALSAKGRASTASAVPIRRVDDDMVRGRILLTLSSRPRARPRGARGVADPTLAIMRSLEIDAYLSVLSEDDGRALRDLRRLLHELIPGASECISYRVPAMRLGDGPVVAGFAAFRRHLNYLPFSGGILAALSPQLKGRSHTKSALHFTAAQPLPPDLIELLVARRLDEITERGR